MFDPEGLAYGLGQSSGGPSTHVPGPMERRVMSAYGAFVMQNVSLGLAVVNPRQTASNLKQAATHPGDTAIAVLSVLPKAAAHLVAGTPEQQGEAFTTLGTIVAPLGPLSKAGKGVTALESSAKVTAEETQKLFRAVGPAELKDVKNTEAFRNPEGIENKYFSTTEAGAEQYGKMAEKAFGDPPHTTVETSIPKKEITPEMKVQVDSGIDTVVVPTAKLNKLEKPVVKEKKQ